MKDRPGSMYGKLKSDASDMENIRFYLKLLRGESVALDEYVCKDIDVDELFCYCNRCITPLGELMLYDRFRQMRGNLRLADDEDDISKIREDAGFRSEVEGALCGLYGKKPLSVADLLNLSVRIGRWHRFLWIVPVMELAVLVLMLLYITPAVTIIYAIAALAFNVYLHYWNRTYVDLFIRPLLQLERVRIAAVRLSAVDRFNNIDDVRLSAARMSRLSSKLGVFSMNSLLESDVMILFYGLAEMLKIVTCIEPVMTYVILKDIDDVSRHSRTLSEYIGRWDALYSISSFREWMDECGLVWSRPAFVHERSTLKASSIRHPLIKDCVANDIGISGSVIITGSNMSGKSSFLKTLAVNIVSSYAMNMCFAERFSLSPCRVSSVISVSDSIDEGKSYYMSEALRIGRIIDTCSSEKGNLTDFVFIDEIFRGTNTIERISIADSVIRYLSSLENTVAVVSTHDIELARGLETELATYHFNESVGTDSITFSYRILPGVVYTRNAISLLRLCGYPTEIVENAEKKSKNIKFLI